MSPITSNVDSDLDIGELEELDFTHTQKEEDDEPGLCPGCNGSGEGMYDGSTCRTCHGEGEI